MTNGKRWRRRWGTCQEKKLADENKSIVFYPDIRKASFYFIHLQNCLNIGGMGDPINGEDWRWFGLLFFTIPPIVLGYGVSSRRNHLIFLRFLMLSAWVEWEIDFGIFRVSNKLGRNQVISRTTLINHNPILLLRLSSDRHFVLLCPMLSLGILRHPHHLHYTGICASSHPSSFSGKGKTSGGI